MLEREMVDWEISPPEGFAILPGCEQGFLQLVGPLYVKSVSGTPIGMPVIGFYALEKHLNYSGGMHGGMVATVADMQGAAIRTFAQLGDVATPTISISVDFIAPIRPGAWIELHSFLAGRTQSLLFSRGEVRRGDEVVGRTSAIYKIGRVRKLDVELNPLSITGY